VIHTHLVAASIHVDAGHKEIINVEWSITKVEEVLLRFWIWALLVDAKEGHK